MMTFSKTLRVGLALVLLVQPSCIHVQTTETKLVDKPDSPKSSFEVITTPQMKMESVVYSAEKYPLSDFFTKLKAGEFNEAIKNLDLDYKPSNTDSKILREVMDDGFVPAYVRIRNEGSIPIKLRESNFKISDGKIEIVARSADYAPWMFERFNSKALAANVFNGTVGIVGIFSLLFVGGALGTVGEVMSSGVRGSQLHTFKEDPDGYDGMNTLQKKTRIEYKDYLITEHLVLPNETYQGLLFFWIDPKIKHGEFKLVFGEGE